MLSKKRVAITVSLSLTFRVAIVSVCAFEEVANNKKAAKMLNNVRNDERSVPEFRLRLFGTGAREVDSSNAAETILQKYV